MATELTRAELFKQVWERPMTKVAADYGISNVAPKKICDKHRILVPGCGYWAKKAAGQRVKQPLFISVTDPVINRIVIYGSPEAKLPAAVREAKAEARAKASNSEERPKVRNVPDDLHPAVLRLQKKLTKAGPRANGLISTKGARLFDVEISPDNINRVIAFLDDFVRAAGARGYHPAKGEEHLVFQGDGETITFKVVEPIDSGRTARR